MTEGTSGAMPSLGFAFVGSFTTQARRARGLGIDVYRSGVETAPDRWSPIERIESLPNPSYLLSDPTRHILYSVHGDGDKASVFAIDAATGRLQCLGSAATGGSNGVHLALDPSRRFLVVANYGTGSVAVLPVRPDGMLEPAIQVLDLPGPVGPHRIEQACAHPHQIVFDPSGAFILVPDKGLDRVFVLSLSESGRIEVAGQVAMRPGAGPRHLVFHPSRPLVFLLNEIDSTVATLHWDATSGALSSLHLVSTLPPDFFGASTAAAIVVTPCGGFVYASNRGEDGIVRLAFDDATGRLAVKGWTRSGGRDPRFMSLDAGNGGLLVANEQSDSLVGFAIDAGSGDLSPLGMRHSLSPCTIAFL